MNIASKITDKYVFEYAQHIAKEKELGFCVEEKEKVLDQLIESLIKYTKISLGEKPQPKYPIFLNV